MICNATETGWEVLYQNAHARVAMDLLVGLREPLRPPRWGELLYATAQHDNGWQEWEPGDRRTPLGTPRHFLDTTPADVVRQSDMALGRVRHASLFGGLLLAEHYRSLYGEMEDPAVCQMLTEQDALRRQWRRALGVGQAEVAAHYAWLRWADTLSLYLCTRSLPLDGLRAEVGEAGGEAYWAWQRGDGSIGLDPWPYETKAVEVRTEAYALHALTFASDAALAEALAEARPEALAWTLRPEPSGKG